HVWRLQGRVRDRQEVREVTRARQRVGVAAIRVDDREEAGDQSDQADEGQQRRPCARAEDRLEAVEQGGGRVAQVLRATADRGVEQEDQRPGDDERGQAPHRCSRDVALGIVRLLGGKRQLLDREV